MFVTVFLGGRIVLKSQARVLDRLDLNLIIATFHSVIV